MEMKNEANDFHRTLEPMVIIDDDDDDDDVDYNSVDHYNHNKSVQYVPDERDPLSLDNFEKDFIHSVGPEISITPVRQWKSQIKVRLFEKEYSPSTEDTHAKVQCSARSREKVRRISKDEALNAEETYTRRRSNPLEKCPICKKYFRRMKTHLLKHEVVSSRAPEDRLLCSLCQKAFNSQSNLAIHMRSHTGDKPYICEVCQKSFSQSCNLVNHMRVHTGEKPFKCPHCDRAFTQSGNLNNHIRLHTDEKPFKCHFCDKAFVQSGNLNSHIRNNHKYHHPAIEILPIPQHLL